jgi:hypothetical protein
MAGRADYFIQEEMLRIGEKLGGNKWEIMGEVSNYSPEH